MRLMDKAKLKVKHKRYSKKAKIALQKRIDKLHMQIRSELVGSALTNPADIIRHGREERDQQLLESVQVWHK